MHNVPLNYKGWALKAPFDSIVNKEFKEGTQTVKFTTHEAAIEKIITGLSSGLAGTLADLIDSSATTLSGVTYADSTTADLKIASVTLTDDSQQGLYMAIVTPADADMVYSPVFVSADFNANNGTQNWIIDSTTETYNPASAVKMSTVSIDKKAKKTDSSYDQTWKSTRIGEVVDYTVDTVIPGYGDVYQDPIYRVKDKLTDLKLTGKPVLVAPANAVATITGDQGDTEYTIEFDPDYLKTLKVPTPVQITYSAVVVSTANLNINKELNEVWVEYTHDWEDESDYRVKKDETVHYTYTIDADLLGGYGKDTEKSGSEIVKVGLDEKDKPIMQTTIHSDVTPAEYWTGPLEDAEFVLYKEDGTTPYKTSVYYDSPYFATPHKEESVRIFSKADGRLYSVFPNGDRVEGIVGLDAGVYYLEETVAPAGFIRDTRKRKIEIVATLTEKEFTEYYDGTNWYAANDPQADPSTMKSATYKVETLDKYQILIDDQQTTVHFYNDGGFIHEVEEATGTEELPHSFINKKGIELPSTGGMGTTLFYAIGAILVLGAGILLVSKRRMAAY
jgi:LPXTG-motif cell wall-anchored protein